MVFIGIEFTLFTFRSRHGYVGSERLTVMPLLSTATSQPLRDDPKVITAVRRYKNKNPLNQRLRGFNVI